uniref:Uncharacterized protein n=1 Tax=Mus musculus TaxID=10090 RepID=Q9D253_MOUSE|nr:unnamed protein product [Mus musculus]
MALYSLKNRAQCSGLPALQCWPHLCCRAPGLEVSRLALGPSVHAVQEHWSMLPSSQSVWLSNSLRPREAQLSLDVETGVHGPASDARFGESCGLEYSTQASLNILIAKKCGVPQLSARLGGCHETWILMSLLTAWY